MLSEFPFLLGRAFIEAITRSLRRGTLSRFPFLLGRAFIEAEKTSPAHSAKATDFPSFWEELSLRPCPARCRAD